MIFNILIIDDSKDDLFFFEKAIQATGLSIQLVCLDQSSLVLDMLRKKSFDCIFLDYNMPVMDGLSLLKKIKEEKLSTPVIMLTGQNDAQMIVTLMKEGATDYLSKDQMSSETLRISIENARRLSIIQKEKKQAERALKHSESSLAEAQKIGHIGNWQIDFDKHILVFSDEAMRITEVYNVTDITMLSFCRHIHPKDFHIFKNAFRKLRANEPYDITIRYTGWTKQEKSLNLKARLLSDNKAIGTIQDITVLKHALLETQKATIKSHATTIVLVIAVVIFLLSEAVLDPFIDSLTASLIISLSFKGSIAMALKPLELLLEKIMKNRMAIS
jgi:FixJ family two-component response regulator